MSVPQISRRAMLAGFGASLALAGCGTPVVSRKDPPATTDIAALAAEIRALDPAVDPAEARRAAEISYVHTAELAEAYQITDPPLIHNAKVNRGVKPRGLCWHWAEDMEKRLNAESFETLEMHRAIANADSRILIDHSTAIISAKGQNMFQGIVLDPWRKGGTLFWSTVTEDTRYDWVPRMEVLEKYGRITYVPAG